ncbi:hypothetical protein Mal4_55020 [Maioricimonas rarisocia]|uniref:DUF4190 domain-containing protein n=1 Tax=Maioricimonas rarisocia TaxID=2528026 RepID=A0A517ZF69_9PLAN|nr:DUF4190 domain-containing protein [Maioricimonas rarisocia]QDU41137.1 hypothetical protein Mal4_55020 [Maioricimonas rarisocia]
MSQVLDRPDAADESVDRGEYGKFDYQPVPVVAVVGCILGVLSVTAMLGLFGILLALLGTVISLLALFQIRRAAGALGGVRLSTAGLVLSVGFFFSGTAYQVYAYQTEVPEGYDRVSFTQEIAKKGFVIENDQQQVHPDVKGLVGKKIFLKGFMYPTGQTADLPSFLLLKDSGQCCFGGQPALTDMIGVVMEEGKHVDYYAGRVSVAGTFELNTKFTGEDSLEPLYILRGEFFSKARTQF